MVSSINPMASALQEMQAMASEAAGASNAASSASSSGDFASMLQDSLSKVSASQQKVATEAKAFEMGAPDVAINDVMLDAQKANISFQTAIQVRNKVVSAYNDVMQMSV